MCLHNSMCLILFNTWASEGCKQLSVRNISAIEPISPKELENGHIWLVWSILHLAPFWLTSLYFARKMHWSPQTEIPGKRWKCLGRVNATGQLQIKCDVPENWCLCLRVENRTSVLHLFMSFMGLTGWGGVGWGGIITFIGTSSHIWCYVIVWGGVGWGNNVHWHFLTYMMLRYCVGWGGVGWGNNVHWHLLTYVMLRYCNSSCTSSHIWCYATVIRLALLHIYDATLL